MFRLASKGTSLGLIGGSNSQYRNEKNIQASQMVYSRQPGAICYEVAEHYTQTNVVSWLNFTNGILPYVTAQ